jgi:amidophosphoribosyltransferase
MSDFLADRSSAAPSASCCGSGAGACACASAAAAPACGAGGPPSRRARCSAPRDEDGAITTCGAKAVEENCGVFGCVGQENASRVVFFGLYALNHRECGGGRGQRGQGRMRPLAGACKGSGARAGARTLPCLPAAVPGHPPRTLAGRPPRPVLRTDGIPPLPPRLSSFPAGGQESAGLASLDRHGIHVHKGMGLVSQVFDEADIATLTGAMAIGHTRYSTAGGSKLAGAQPFVLETDLGQLAIAHNGQVAKQMALRKLVLARGVGLFTNSDSEVIAQMLARPHAPAEAEAFAAAEAAKGGDPIAPGGAVTPSGTPVWACWLARAAAFMRECEGAYSLVALTKDALYGIRDPHGLRPLCVGQARAADGTWSYHLTSESCALSTVGSDFVREVRPGEVVRLDKNGIRSWLPLQQPALAALVPTVPIPKNPSFCVFEYVYFARPDSLMEGQLVHSARTRLGAQLAREAPVLHADLVSGVPDSSIAAAIGYANELKLPFSEVFCKNRYIGRTFIKPDDQLRKNAIQLKYNPLTAVLAGKKVVLVDDSLVRGNTLRQLVPLLRKGGAKEVHIRISSPPIRHPCYYGVDIGRCVRAGRGCCAQRRGAPGRRALTHNVFPPFLPLPPLAQLRRADRHAHAQRGGHPRVH